MLGYDLAHFNAGDIDEYKEKNPNMPDVVLVKKVKVKSRKKKAKAKREKEEEKRALQQHWTIGSRCVWNEWG